VDVVSFVDEGLGHSSYLVDLGDGSALVIDPGRFPIAQREEAARRGVRIAFTADTHSHADYVSGSPELAAEGAVFLAPAAGHLHGPHRPVRDREVVDVGRFGLEAVATPGHTPDHLAYVLRADGEPVALFSGGSLMVGTVGRTDLLGPEPAEGLARTLFHSLHERLLTLPDALAVYPTHGAGSFCSAPGASERTTTIGRERATNPMLQIADEDAFVAELLAGLGSFPAYFGRLPEVNRRGARLYGTLPELGRLSLDEFRTRVDAGAQLVDARPKRAFGAAHIPGALAIELRPVFASWLGWLLDPDRPVVFVLDADQDRHELVRQALDVGIESLAGELDGGMATWLAAGLETASIPVVGPADIAGTVLDVRQDNEFDTGHVPEALHVELGALADARDLPAGPLTVMCGHGERAMTGASILARVRREVAVLDGGPETWAAALGRPLTVGA
jgi:glyoxylase-like metal-dependent hydrolase (beta-lactamase superfamily II)